MDSQSFVTPIITAIISVGISTCVSVFLFRRGRRQAKIDMLYQEIMKSISSFTERGESMDDAALELVQRSITVNCSTIAETTKKHLPPGLLHGVYRNALVPGSEQTHKDIEALHTYLNKVI